MILVLHIHSQYILVVIMNITTCTQKLLYFSLYYVLLIYFRRDYVKYRSITQYILVMTTSSIDILLSICWYVCIENFYGEYYTCVPFGVNVFECVYVCMQRYEIYSRC